MILDMSAAARRVEPERAREWLSEQRAFLSSAMGDTAVERKAVAKAVEEEGARAVMFEELGRDAAAEEAYLAGVDSSTIYLAILKELYGTMLESGWSPTETEYWRAREQGKRLAVFTAADAPVREGHLRRFIERIRVFVTTESYSDLDDIVRRVRRRLHELAAEALSPWVKLGDYVFRADLIDDHGANVTLQARVNDEIAHAFEELRDRQWGRERLRLTYASRVVDGDLTSVRRTTRAGGASEMEIALERVTPPASQGSRFSIGGLSPDDLAEVGLRTLFLGEPLPSSLGPLSSMSEPSIAAEDLHQVFDLPNEIAEGIARLVVTEGLVGAGNASRIAGFSLGPKVSNRRRVALEWVELRPYANVEPGRRTIEGEWAMP